MDDVSRYVNIAFLVGGLILAFVMVNAADMILGSFSQSADPIVFVGRRLSFFIGLALGGGIAGYYWKREKTRQLATEVVVELSKVTWPTSEETQRSTKVVIAFTVVSAVTLFMFDFVWKFVTDQLLSVS